MYIIALNAFREIIRGRFLSLIGFFVIIEIFGLIFLNTISLDQTQYIVVDIWLSFIEIIGVFIILFLWNRLLAREFEEKTIYLTLSRPISRGKIIFGKFFGFAVIIALLVTVLSVILMGLMMFFQVAISGIFLVSILGILLKLVTLVAIMLFFSIFLSSGIATFATLAVYIVAHSGYALLEFALTHADELMLNMGRAVLFIFPNFQALNFKNMVHLTQLPEISHFALAIVFAVIYIWIILFLSQYIFNKKSFDNI